MWFIVGFFYSIGYFHNIMHANTTNLINWVTKRGEEGEEGRSGGERLWEKEEIVAICYFP